MIGTSGRVFVNDDFRAVLCHPIVHLPCISRVTSSKQRRHLFFHTNGVRTNPHRKTNHTRLVHDIMIKARSNIDSHWPHFLVLWISIRIDFRLRVTPSITATMAITTWCTSTTGPVHSSHIEVDVIGDLNIWIVFFHPIISPEVTASLTAFFTRPQAEHHGVAGVEIRHRFSDGEHHCGACSVIISTNTSSICSPKDVRVEHPTIHRWRDVKVSAKHHPLIRVDITKSVATDVVCLRVLSSCHE